MSKGRDGYMGIGLSAHGVNVNRLPGWDKHSYGYHGDDGHSFCSSGTGQPYGPTFTTGDVIGCGVNLVDNTAFYTKNGHHLGIAFTDLPVSHSSIRPKAAHAGAERVRYLMSHPSRAFSCEGKKIDLLFLYLGKESADVRFTLFSAGHFEMHTDARWNIVTFAWHVNRTLFLIANLYNQLNISTCCTYIFFPSAKLI